MILWVYVHWFTFPADCLKAASTQHFWAVYTELNFNCFSTDCIGFIKSPRNSSTRKIQTKAKYFLGFIFFFPLRFSWKNTLNKTLVTFFSTRGHLPSGGLSRRAFPFGIATQKGREQKRWHRQLSPVSTSVLCFPCVFNKYKEQFLALL